MEKLKVGVFGCGRGMTLARNLMLNGCEVVAICDFHKERREAAAKQVDASVAVYDNFEDFINHEMDVMILANYFHEHAPYAIRCFEKGIHVFSECLSNGTMAEGVELIKAFEKSSGAVYFMAENYPQMVFNREMQRVCKTGTLGKILYAEGEYNHPTDTCDVEFMKEYNYFQGHWRNFIPRTYYITHSLGPVMAATGATAKRVTAFAVYDPVVGAYPTASYRGDRVAIITTQNDDGSVFRVTGCAAFGAHHNAYRICGTEEDTKTVSPPLALRRTTVMVSVLPASTSSAAETVSSRAPQTTAVMVCPDTALPLWLTPEAVTVTELPSARVVCGVRV